MQTELQLSVIYLSQEENDINEFDFFIRMIPTEERNIIYVSVVPRFNLDGKVVKNIRFSVISREGLYAFDVLNMLSELKELQNIISDITIPTQKAEEILKTKMIQALDCGKTE